MRSKDDHRAGYRLALRTLARLLPEGDVCEGQIMVAEGKVRAEAISNFWGWGMGITR